MSPFFHSNGNVPVSRARLSKVIESLSYQKSLKDVYINKKFLNFLMKCFQNINAVLGKNMVPNIA